MKKIVELPIEKPMFSTFHPHAAGTIITNKNPSIRNWNLNNSMILSCERKFLDGYTTPILNICEAAYFKNPHIFAVRYPLRFLGRCTHSLIRNLLDNEIYVYFTRIDDFYLTGKSWYHKRHFIHDGIIYGYDMENKTYSLYAYDENWVLRKFKVSINAVDKAIKSALSMKQYGFLVGIKASDDYVSLDCKQIYLKLNEYLDSSLEKYPLSTRGTVYGIVVHKYLYLYLEMLQNGSIPHEKMDWRIFRLIWEHKKIMFERIQEVEKQLGLDSSISSEYADVVKESENIRMLYAVYHRKKRNSVLNVIKSKFLYVDNQEKVLLQRLINKMKNAMQL